MDTNESRTQCFETKLWEMINGEGVSNNFIENKREENETKINSKNVNCKEEGAQKDNSASLLEEKEEKFSENMVVNEKPRTKIFELTKEENDIIILQDNSKNGIKSEFSKLQMEDKETQTEPLSKERKDDDSPTIMDTLMQNLLQQIECPVCYEYMLPPIIQCNNGHNICKTCKPGLLHCPTCREQFSNVKNNVAETLSKSITHPCKYRSSGCTGQFLVGLDPDCKGIHEGECRYGPHKCPYNIVNTCAWEGPMPDMKQHIENNHERTMYVREGKQINCNINYIKNITEGYWHRIVFTQDHVFFSYWKISNNLLYMCFMFVGSKEDVNNFKYTVSIKSCDGHKNVTSCFECPHYLDCTDGKFPNDKCAAFHVDFTRLCVNNDGGLPYEYEIFQ